MLNHTTCSLGAVGTDYFTENRSGSYSHLTTHNNFVTQTPALQQLHRHHHLSQAPHLNSWVDNNQFSPATLMLPPGSIQNMHSGYGDLPYHAHHQTILRSSGAQSFTGIYYDRISQHLPVEGDLGYALQRPGVVPSMGMGEQVNPNLLQQQHLSGNNGSQQGMYGYSPQRHSQAIHSNHLLSGSLPTNAVFNQPWRQQNQRRSFNGYSTVSNIQAKNSPMLHSQSNNRQEACNLDVSNHGDMDNELNHSEFNFHNNSWNPVETSVDGGTSLLAKQLALADNSAHVPSQGSLSQPSPSLTFPNMSSGQQNQQQVQQLTSHIRSMNAPNGIYGNTGSNSVAGIGAVDSQTVHGGHYNYAPLDSSCGSAMLVSASSHVADAMELTSAPTLGYVQALNGSSYGSCQAIHHLPGGNSLPSQIIEGNFHGAPPPLLSYSNQSDPDHIYSNVYQHHDQSTDFSATNGAQYNWQATSSHHDKHI